MRLSLLPLLAPLALAGLVACSDGAPAPTSDTPASGQATFAAPAPSSSSNSPPPLIASNNSTSSSSDAGATVVSDAATSPVVVDAGAVDCPGGEAEVEPNDSTPNELTSIRCGTLQPGEKDLLQVSLTAFNIEWKGAINVTLTQPVAGGPYVLNIASLTPSVATPWTITLKK